MGGKAFSTGPSPLSTPRMPETVYLTLRDKYLKLMLTLFDYAATPVEAPEKPSFGDIDILVCNPKTLPMTVAIVGESLNAVRTIPSKSNYTFAVPYPGIQEEYVQIDVHVCPSDRYRWEVFHHCHGDLWNLLGTSIRLFGFTANNIGLHLRIPEIENSDRKRAQLFLTSDPDTVLELLGLDRDTYSHLFDSVDSMFDFVCQSRFFRSGSYAKLGLKASDRKRMAQRELYRRFVDEYLPTKRLEANGEGLAKEVGLSREQVLEEMIYKFGLSDEYNARVQNWREEVANQKRRKEAKEARRAREKDQVQ